MVVNDSHTINLLAGINVDRLVVDRRTIGGKMVATIRRLATIIHQKRMNTVEVAAIMVEMVATNTTIIITSNDTITITATMIGVVGLVNRCQIGKWSVKYGMGNWDWELKTVEIFNLPKNLKIPRKTITVHWFYLIDRSLQRRIR
jgi:hypothetical protein